MLKQFKNNSLVINEQNTFISNPMCIFSFFLKTFQNCLSVVCCHFCYSLDQSWFNDSLTKISFFFVYLNSKILKHRITTFFNNNKNNNVFKPFMLITQFLPIQQKSFPFVELILWWPYSSYYYVYIFVFFWFVSFFNFRLILFWL